MSTDTPSPATPAPTDRGGRMSTPTPDRSQWSVTVTVPSDLPGAMRDSLFGLIANAAHLWEPSTRDGWDVDVSAGLAASAPQGDTADVIERAGVDRDELGLGLAEHWVRQGIVETSDSDPDQFEDDDTIVFRAYRSAVDVILSRLAAAGLLASPVPEVVIERARHIIADHCFGPHATPAAEERALDIASACTDDLADQGLLAVAASPVAPVMQPTHIQAADELDRGAAQLADVADITQSRSAYGYGYRIAYERIVDWLRHEFEPSAPAPADDEAAQVERMAVAIAKDDGFDWRSGEWNGVYLSRARAALAALKEGHRA